jgi:hypothetical protein
MQACGSRFSLSQRLSASRQGSNRLPGDLTLLNARFGGYPAVVVAELAAHPGNAGLKVDGHLGNVGKQNACSSCRLALGRKQKAAIAPWQVARLAPGEAGGRLFGCNA